MKTLTIDPEFRDKIPPMTEEEFRQLEENILKAGRVRSPITVWNNIIVDGHNRWAIIQKHPDIPYEVEEEHFADRYEAIVWICKNQLGRRNLTDAQKTYLIGRQYEAQKKTRGARDGFRGNQHSGVVKVQNEPLPKLDDTAQRVANDIGVARSTVKRAEKFTKGVDVAEKIDNGAREAILSGRSKVPQKVIAELPKMEPAEQKEVIFAAKSGSSWPPRKESSVGRRTGYNSEQRQLNAAIRDAVAGIQDTGAPVEHTVDDLIEDLTAIITDFQGKARRSIANHSALLRDEDSKKRVIAALSEAETAIEKMKGYCYEQ